MSFDHILTDLPGYTNFVFGKFGYISYVPANKTVVFIYECFLAILLSPIALISREIRYYGRQWHLFCDFNMGKIRQRKSDS